MTFLYASPYGQPRTLTMPGDFPTSPAVAAAGNGRAYVVWPDNGTPTGAYLLWASRFHPDSGFSPRFRLAPATAYSLPSVSIALDTAGTLYSVWQLSAAGTNEIHYQRRTRQGVPTPRDTTLETLGDGLQNPRVALDLLGGVHVAYERTSPQGLELCYRRWRPTRGWDFRATQVSEDADNVVSQAQVLPITNGNVSVLWTGFDGQRGVLRERRRRLDGNAVADVPTVAPANPAVALSAGPSPLRAGTALVVRGAGLRDGAPVELLDASGRRALVAPALGGAAHFAPRATAGLAPGIYFARARGSESGARIVVLR